MKDLMSEKISEAWEKKREAFLATNPKCTECGGGFDHYSRTGICRKCQMIKYKEMARAKEPERSRAYRKKYRKRIKAQQAAYYGTHREEISQRKKIKYREKTEVQCRGKTAGFIKIGDIIPGVLKEIQAARIRRDK